MNNEEKKNVAKLFSQNRQEDNIKYNLLVIATHIDMAITKLNTAHQEDVFHNQTIIDAYLNEIRNNFIAVVGIVIEISWFASSINSLLGIL